MRVMRFTFALVALLLASIADAQSLPERMLLAEDARPESADGLAPLVEGLKSQDPGLRRQAVRALGRLERADLVPRVAPILADRDAAVRAEASNALAQLANASIVADVQAQLLGRMRSERDPSAWGAAAASLGRLPYTDAAQVARAEQTLAPVLPAPPDRSSRPPHYGQPDAMLGGARGLEALVRISRKIAPPSTTTVESLRAAAVLRGNADDGRFARIRRFAWLALTSLGQVDTPRVESGLADPDEEVRRLAVAAAGTDVLLDLRSVLLQKGLADASPRVRYEALRGWGRHLQRASCEPIRAALRDESPHVRLQAIDLLGSGCHEESPEGTLVALAEVLTARPGEWHAPAHALVALARVAPDRARPLLPRYVAHGTWQARMYAARAATTLQAFDALDTLARDAHDNVREAALAGLVELKRPEAVRAALDALATRRDYQLLLTSARALSAQQALLPVDQRARARRVLVDALARVTSEQRETSRDPRIAMLDRLKEMGPPEAAESGALTGVLRARLGDFDPVVARNAADVLGAWTNTPQQPSPQRLPRARLELAGVAADRDVRLRFNMAERGTFTLRLLVDQAPLSALRVLTLAETGYYNGLTFHRVVPNFVIQGGSPGANEYTGDGPFMRDEAGLVSHGRGTVGISTRGRDTGDAQIFVNLVDLARLDHTYTVFAEVVDGMDVVDGILEGDVIDSVTLQPARQRP